MTQPDLDLSRLRALAQKAKMAHGVSLPYHEFQTAVTPDVILHLVQKATERETLDRILNDLWGDPEDCDDCADLETRPCRVHQAEFMKDVAKAAGVPVDDI